MTKISIPLWKIAATAGGTALTGAAVWMNAQHIGHDEGWGSPLVAAAVIVTLCAAVTPPFAERAAKTRQPAKAAMLWLFFGLAVAFSLTTSIARSSSYADSKLAGAEQANAKAQLAKEAYAAAQATQADECAKRGPKCRAAENAVTAARNALASTAPVQAADPGAARIAAVLGIDEASVRLYMPLLLPLGLEFGGFIFLAAGLAPRRREPELQPIAAISVAAETVATPAAEPVATPAQDPVATPAKRGSRAYYLQRLETEHPGIATRVHSGELSVHAACIAAGLRKAQQASQKWTKADAYLKSAGVPA